MPYSLITGASLTRSTCAICFDVEMYKLHRASVAASLAMTLNYGGLSHSIYRAIQLHPATLLFSFQGAGSALFTARRAFNRFSFPECSYSLFPSSLSALFPEGSYSFGGSSLSALPCEHIVTHIAPYVNTCLAHFRRSLFCTNKPHCFSAY